MIPRKKHQPPAIAIENFVSEADEKINGLIILAIQFRDGIG